MKPYLSVIIPMYNEEENLKRGVLEEVRQNLKKMDFDFEVIVSDDESTDNSRETAKAIIKKLPEFKLLENPHGGKPFAIKAGIEKASGEISMFADMDQSTPISETSKLLTSIKNGNDIVIGSRGTERKDFPWYRRMMSWSFRTLRRLFVLRGLVDTQCGFKMFKTEAGKRVFNKMTIFGKRGSGWKVGAWDVEFLFVAEKLGYKIKEVSVIWTDNDISQGKKRNFVKESREMFSEVFRVILNNWEGKYE